MLLMFGIRIQNHYVDLICGVNIYHVFCCLLFSCGYCYVNIIMYHAINRVLDEIVSSVDDVMHRASRPGATGHLLLDRFIPRAMAGEGT